MAIFSLSFSSYRRSSPKGTVKIKSVNINGPLMIHDLTCEKLIIGESIIKGAICIRNSDIEQLFIDNMEIPELDFSNVSVGLLGLCGVKLHGCWLSKVHCERMLVYQEVIAACMQLALPGVPTSFYFSQEEID